MGGNIKPYRRTGTVRHNQIVTASPRGAPGFRRGPAISVALRLQSNVESAQTMEARNEQLSHRFGGTALARPDRPRYAWFGIVVLATMIPDVLEEENAVRQISEVVVSASRVSLPSDEVGSAITVITAEDIERTQTRVRLNPSPFRDQNFSLIRCHHPGRLFSPGLWNSLVSPLM